MFIGLGLGLNRNGGRGTPPTPAAPTNVSVPAISGSAVQGETLTASPGSWTGEPFPSFSYQWKAAGVNISGATSSAYVLTASEVGKTITVTVAATNSQGSASATSAATSAVVADPDVVTPTAPTLTWDTDSSDNTPQFTVALTSPSVDDVVTFQIDTDSGFGSTSDSSDTVDAGEVTASEVTFTLDTLADGTYYTRAKVTRDGVDSAWSSTVVVTISTVTDFNAILRTDGSYLLRTDGSKILRAA